MQTTNQPNFIEALKAMQRVAKNISEDMKWINSHTFTVRIKSTSNPTTWVEDNEIEKLQKIFPKAKDVRFGARLYELF